MSILKSILRWVEHEKKDNLGPRPVSTASTILKTILTKLTKAQHPHLSYFFKHFLPDLKYKCSNVNKHNPNKTPTASKIKALIKFNIPILFCDLSLLSFLAWQAPDCQNDWSLSISPLYWSSSNTSSISSFNGESRRMPTPYPDMAYHLPTVSREHFSSLPDINSRTLASYRNACIVLERRK